MTTEAKVKWNITGNYFEACNCEAACLCVFLSPPTTEECTVLVGWHIEQGAFGDLALDGLNVALAVHSPGPMAEVQWKVALYLDENTSQTQQDALTQIFAGQAGGHFAAIGQHIGEVLGVKSAAIDFQANGKQRSLRIGGVAETNIEAIVGGGGAQVTVSGDPLGIVPGEPMVVARSGRLSYHDHGMEWELSSKNGFYSAFTYQGP
ncbi:MAG: DUF1326 domain-containing protein [Dehalococcoidia bacterium]|nr:DUF1326 domain-containing protein [Dehalococcoidia bacterium]